MTKYIIRELQNPNSNRQGDAIEANSLTAAKRRASKMQMFQGTCMVIESESGGFYTRLAIKEDGQWRNYE